MSEFSRLLSFSSLWLFGGAAVAQAVNPTGNQVTSKPISYFKVKCNSRKQFDDASLRALGKDLRKRQIAAVVGLRDNTIIRGDRKPGNGCSVIKRGDAGTATALRCELDHKLIQTRFAR